MRRNRARKKIDRTGREREREEGKKREKASFTSSMYLSANTSLQIQYSAAAVVVRDRAIPHNSRARDGGTLVGRQVGGHSNTHRFRNGRNDIPLPYSRLHHTLTIYSRLIFCFRGRPNLNGGSTRAATSESTKFLRRAWRAAKLDGKTARCASELTLSLFVR